MSAPILQPGDRRRHPVTHLTARILGPGSRPGALAVAYPDYETEVDDAVLASWWRVDETGKIVLCERCSIPMRSDACDVCRPAESVPQEPPSPEEMAKQLHRAWKLVGLGPCGGAVRGIEAERARRDAEVSDDLLRRLLRRAIGKILAGRAEVAELREEVERLRSSKRTENALAMHEATWRKVLGQWLLGETNIRPGYLADKVRETLASEPMYQAETDPDVEHLRQTLGATSKETPLDAARRVTRGLGLAVDEVARLRSQVTDLEGYRDRVDEAEKRVRMIAFQVTCMSVRMAEMMEHVLLADVLIAEAVAGMKERCAKVVETLHGGCASRDKVAAAIRALSDTSKSAKRGEGLPVALERVREAAKVVVGAFKLNVTSRKGDAELRAAALATLTPEETAEAEAAAHREWVASSPSTGKPTV